MRFFPFRHKFWWLLLVIPALLQASEVWNTSAFTASPVALQQAAALVKADKDAVATVLKDVGLKIDGERLAATASHFDRACVQRLGYLLDRLGYAERTDAMRQNLSATKLVPWVALEPMRQGNDSLSVEPVERNERWRVTVQRHPEIDE